MVEDRPGVIADITAVLRDCGVSLRSMLQHPAENETTPYVPLVLVTHQTSEAAMQDAITKIDALSVVTDSPVMIRIETA